MFGAWFSDEGEQESRWPLVQMKMVRHQDAGMHLPASLGAGIAGGFDEALAIPVIHKNRLPPVAASHQVIAQAPAGERRARRIIAPARQMPAKTNAYCEGSGTADKPAK